MHHMQNTLKYTHTHTVKRINMINHIVMRADVKGPSTGRSVYMYTQRNLTEIHVHVHRNLIEIHVHVHIECI